MSDLTQFRDHARFMADREHGPGCPPVRSKPGRMHHFDGRKWCGDEKAHDQHEWQAESRFGGDYAPTWTCHGICGGCNSEDDRALWRRLAAEIDDYLEGPEEEDLFGELSAEPTAADDGSAA